MCHVTLTHINLEINKGSFVLSSQKLLDVNVLPWNFDAIWKWSLIRFLDKKLGYGTKEAKSHIQKYHFHLQTSERRVEMLGLAFFF